MKTPFAASILALASAATLPAAVTITAEVIVPNGTASGGTGSGGNTKLEASIGTLSVTTLGLPATTYAVTGIDLTSLGGTANESFSFTVTYTATTDGITVGTPTFSGFGNVGVGTGGTVTDPETLTATVALNSSSFAELSLVGFTLARAGGANAGESGTLTWTGGSFNVTPGNTIANTVSGNSFTLTASASSTLNIEGFKVDFVAVPEPATASLLGLMSLALLRRRRTA
ncbi:MAG: PEP-CTERM sorting domain-containing protein [Verrucomicrobiae bacterium]|nr:PEP-CTERM sorting domain-containing protein [Verrucomicrobiae bacterium]